MNRLVRRLNNKWNFMLVSLVALGGFAFVLPVKAIASKAHIEVISPLSDQTVQNGLSLRDHLLNADPADYIPFWAVDHGQWNRMTSDPNNTSIAVEDIEAGSWNWQKSGNYTLQFIQLNKYDGKVVEQDVQIHIGTDKSLTPLATDRGLLDTLGVATNSVSIPLFHDPQGDITRKIEEGDGAIHSPNEVRAMSYLASQPMAAWFGGWNSNVRTDAKNYVDRAAAAKQLPVLVAYNIPGRDCGSYSAGGANNSDSYISWIRDLADGIDSKPALVILEPDALAGMDCLDKAGKGVRLSLLKQATSILRSSSNTRIYIDAGNPKWHSVSGMADRLKEAGIDKADGFSLNVSNFITTADNISYGTKLASKLDNAHFVIDTSRNGNGPTSDLAWCNPAGRALGLDPTTDTKNNLVDAYLWVKGPGGSDGTCGPNRGTSVAPAAGNWWPQYAMELLTNSGRTR